MDTKRYRSPVIALAAVLMLAMPASLAAQEADQPAAQPSAGASQTGNAAQISQPQEGGVNWSGAGYGAATVVCDLVYVPVKVVYAVLGVLVGAGSYAVTAGNSQVANTVWRSALGGDYVLTPDMLQGKQPINFSGPTETAPEAQATATPSASPPPAAASASGYEPAPATSQPEPIDRGSGPVERSIE